MLNSKHGIPNGGSKGAYVGLGFLLTFFIGIAFV